MSGQFSEISKITFKNKKIFQKLAGCRDKVIHVVLIATKPDIIKQAPLIYELRREKRTVLVVHSGQHYDWNLSGGMEQEFGIEPDINLNVRGVLYEQQSQIIARFGYVLAELKKTKCNIIPYTYGDTTTAVAGGVASFANMIGTAHVEAGLRTMSPPARLIHGLKGNFSVDNYYTRLQNKAGWSRGSYEPYPEQFDTRAAAPSAGVHLAPTDLNYDFLTHEGYYSDRVYVVGNPVSDTIQLTRNRIDDADLVKRMPFAAQENLIRVCVHRRENVSSYHRFKAIMEAVFDLVLEGRNVLFISLPGTENALHHFNLKREAVKLTKSHKNFTYSPVLPFYKDVVGIMNRCLLTLTDSGSIQEETNMLGVPGAILRFNSDRPEAIFAGSNILVPPINRKIIARIVRKVADDRKMNARMRTRPKLYGENVCKKIIKVVDRLTKNRTLFDLLEHDRLKLTKRSDWEHGFVKW